MASVEEQLLAVLEDLGSADLKRFQWHLTLPVLEQCPSIPKCKLEKSSRIETVDQMVATYKAAGAVDITRAVLTKMNFISLVEKLETVPSSSGPPGNSLSATSSPQEFLKKNKAALETRISNIRPILCALEEDEVLSLEEREMVESKTTNTEKNVALLSMVIKKGAQEHFYKALKKSDKFLVQSLEG
ncbi:apoptosis-associated speck-like protein containing a CARD [Esox lucius]|uniref:CARD domain-containing protein n=1 Tax=Esox lucius TaxID=8010 RepID=A0AAY5KKW0_ESOLU|nr:apoptosis-associated speck-like protein containing a CARD [Esox lucius]XP_010892252.1 apoptosis-associated speck-like protein containing a CARD [Esox lucius]